MQFYERIGRFSSVLVREPDPEARRRIGRMLTRLGAIAEPNDAAVDQAIHLLATATRQPASAVEARLQAFTAEDAPTGICTDEPSCDVCSAVELCRQFTRRPSIKELPEGERPRERLLKEGPAVLSDSDLLGIIIRGGTEKESAVDLAKRLLATHGDFRSLANCSVDALTRVAGIGPAKAAQIKAVFEIARRFAAIEFKPGQKFSGSQQVFEHYRFRFQDAREEQFLVLLLDSQYKLIRETLISKGSLDATLVHPREVLAPAIRESAAALLFVHNHPSGDPEPSPADIELTLRLVEAANIVGIKVLDHVIIGNGDYESLAERGLM